MQSAILKTLQYSTNLIVSPDMDGYLSAELMSRRWDTRIVGTYGVDGLLVKNGIDPKKCLFVACNIFSPNYVFIGNHVRHGWDDTNPQSFNPNIYYSVRSLDNMYPFATAHLIAATVEVPTNTYDHARMASAMPTNPISSIPSGLSGITNYLANSGNTNADNMRVWSQRLAHSSSNAVLTGIDEYVQIIRDIEAMPPEKGFIQDDLWFDPADNTKIASVFGSYGSR